MSEWVGITIAGLAFALSIVTWVIQYRRQRAVDRHAEVTVYFHWLESMALIERPGQQPISVGYHLVLENKGPARARGVNLALKDASGHTLTLIDLQPDEFPLAELDANARYPIPFAYEPFLRHARRFEATLSWTDGDGKPVERTLPLRRGQLPK